MEMKDSNVEWIGKIPKHWEVKRLKYLPDYSQNNAFIDGDWIESPYVEDAGIRYLTTGNIGDGVYKDQGNGFISLDTFRILKCKYAYPGDLVISRLNAPYGRSCILNDDFDKYVIAVDNVILRTCENSKYLCYVTQCNGYQREVEDKASGTTMKRISRTNLGNVVIPVAPRNEQDAIVKYLDEKCFEIDNLISNITEQISVLEKYKKSVITEVVTKGLNRNVTMSKIDGEWIEEIPQNWELKPFRYVLNERVEKNNPIRTDERLSLSIDIGVTLYADKTTNLDRYKEDVSQYKLAYSGDLVMNSMNVIVGAVGISKWFGCVSPAYYTYYDNEPNHITARYCDYVFRTPDMRSVLYKLGKGIMAIDRGEGRINTCRLKVPREDLRKIRIPVPPLNEQNEIVNFLDQKCADIDGFIDVKRRQLETLEQYKKSLIYEYVTGKREVPA